MQVVGVDVGYGAVKWVGALGAGCFASVWVPYWAGAERWGIGSALRPLYLDGVPVTVGDRAATRPGAHRPFADGRLADPEALPSSPRPALSAGRTLSCSARHGARRQGLSWPGCTSPRWPRRRGAVNGSGRWGWSGDGPERPPRRGRSGRLRQGFL